MLSERDFVTPSILEQDGNPTKEKGGPELNLCVALSCLLALRKECFLILEPRDRALETLIDEETGLHCNQFRYGAASQWLTNHSSRFTVKSLETLPKRLDGADAPAEG